MCDKKAAKKGEPLPPVTDDINEYVPEKKRPHHKVKHKKVDTIEWCKERIPELNKEIRHMQKHFKQNRPQNSLFVEFQGQYYAQLALQQVATHNPMRLNPSYTGFEPGNIIWTNLRLFWWERTFRRSVAAAVICALIILWAIPVAFVGLISNITYLTDKLHWLRWIYRLPPQLLGIITGLLPTILLSILFVFLPIIIRSMAKVAGNPLAQSVELFTQLAYFGFQIFNGFIVLTLASSATAAVVEVIQQPEKALSMLALGFPKSSNFFISYIILQGLGVAGGSLFQVVGLLSYYAFGYILDNTVRKKWGRFSGLGSMAWGTTFPVFTMLSCITLAYCIISPLILLFATVAFFLIYITYLYNLTYVFTESAETRGMHYPRAIFQTFTGIYLGQVCMLGIFAVGKGWGPIVLQVIGICATVFIHINLNQAFDHLLRYVPLDCMRAMDGVSETISLRGAASEYKEKVLDKRSAKEVHEDESVASDSGAVDDKMEIGKIPLLADRSFKKTRHDNMLVRFLRPDVFASYQAVKRMLPDFYLVEDPADLEDIKHAYHCPDVRAQCPNVWIPRDPMGCSLIEVEKLQKILTVSDENSGFDKKGSIIYTGKPPF